MAPQDFWRADAQFFQESNFLKIDSAEIFLDLIKNRSKKKSRSKNRKFRKFYRRISIENFRFFEKFSDFRFFENFQLKSFYKIFDFSISKNIFDRFLIKSRKISVESIFKNFGSWKNWASALQKAPGAINQLLNRNSFNS